MMNRIHFDSFGHLIISGHQNKTKSPNRRNNENHYIFNKQIYEL